MDSAGLHWLFKMSLEKEVGMGGGVAGGTINGGAVACWFDIYGSVK